MKVSTLIVSLLAAFLRPGATDAPGAPDRSGSPRPLEPANPKARPPRPRIAELRFPLFPPPM